MSVKSSCACCVVTSEKYPVARMVATRLREEQRGGITHLFDLDSICAEHRVDVAAELLQLESEDTSYD